MSMASCARVRQAAAAARRKWATGADHAAQAAAQGEDAAAKVCLPPPGCAAGCCGTSSCITQHVNLHVMSFTRPLASLHVLSTVVNTCATRRVCFLNSRAFLHVCLVQLRGYARAGGSPGGGRARRGRSTPDQGAGAVGVRARRWQRGQPHREHQGACSAARLADLAGCGLSAAEAWAQVERRASGWGPGLAACCLPKEKATQAATQCRSPIC